MSLSKSMLLRMVICLEILLLAVAFEVEEKQRYCGDKLTETMGIVCHHSYANRGTIYYGKRSGDNEDYAYMNNEQLAESSPFAYELLPFLAKFGSAAVLHPRVRRYSWFNSEPGVIEECCKRSCTRTELRKYCGQ